MQRITAPLLTLALLASAPAAAQLPDPGVTFTPGDTALVITDPQNDFLSPKGVTWGVAYVLDTRAAVRGIRKAYASR